jgi:DNA mismatch endonuclease, patch repair protein
MSRIRGKHTTPEKLLRSALWAAGMRYRLHGRTPFGRPDIVFPRWKLAIFVDGCFWHGCPNHYVRPRSREEFWIRKLRQNIERDQRQTSALESAGWRVLRVWEHEVVHDAASVIPVVKAALYNPSWTPPSSPRVIDVRPVKGMDAEIWSFVDLRQNETLEPQLRQRLPRRT